MIDYKNILETFIELSDEGLIITDKNANVVFYREGKSNITGIKDKNPIGKNILEVFPYLNEETSSFYKVLITKSPIINKVQTYKNQLGKNVSIVTSTMPILENGNVVGAFEIFKDLTLVFNLSEKIVSLQDEINNSPSNMGKVSKIQSNAKYTFESIVGEGKSISLLKERAKKISNSSSPIFVYGETGTGKELLIQAIHNEDIKRRNKPFIAQNCAALPHTLLESILFGTEEGSYTGAKDKSGLFELADGGTLFLDEINSMDIELQAKLLRVIQEGEVRRLGARNSKKIDVRIVASTNEEPKELLRVGRLRKDLYYRLNVIYLRVPPLIERMEDLDLLVKYFIEKYNVKLGKHIIGFRDEAASLLKRHKWEGNVRELQHVIESAMNWCDEEYITVNEIKDLVEDNYESKEEEFQALNIEEFYAYGLTHAVETYEKQAIKIAINDAEGNFSKAARNLKLPKQTLQNKIKKYGIEKVTRVR